MSDMDKTSSYGLYLQTVRVEKGISIEKVSAETRIRTEILRSIEAEDHTNLPNDVFVKGFLRSFAGAIDADPQEVLRRFDERRKVSKTVLSPSHNKTPVQRGHGLTLLWVTALMVCLVGGTLLIYRVVHDQEMTATAPPPGDLSQPPNTVRAEPKEATVSAEAASEETDATPAAATETVAEEPATVYRLEITSHEETWLKVIADDARATEHTLKPGEKLNLKAATMFNLLIGNAGGVTVLLNDEPVTIPGDSGQVVNVQLP